jgi:hypothetical protein
MDKIYKNAEIFLMENFPKSYLAVKNEEETSLQHYVDTLSEQLNENISKILREELSTSHNKKPTQISTP